MKSLTDLNHYEMPKQALSALTSVRGEIVFNEGSVAPAIEQDPHVVIRFKTQA